jgi:hypothetical protein
MRTHVLCKRYVHTYNSFFNFAFFMLMRCYCIRVLCSVEVDLDFYFPTRTYGSHTIARLSYTISSLIPHSITPNLIHTTHTLSPQIPDVVKHPLSVQCGSLSVLWAKTAGPISLTIPANLAGYDGEHFIFLFFSIENVIFRLNLNSNFQIVDINLHLNAISIF